MSEYPWNEKNNTFTWLSSFYNPFKDGGSKIFTDIMSLKEILEKEGASQV